MRNTANNQNKKASTFFVDAHSLEGTGLKLLINFYSFRFFNAFVLVVNNIAS